MQRAENRMGVYIYIDNIIKEINRSIRTDRSYMSF